MTQQTSEYMYFVKVSDPVECLSFLEESNAFYVCFLAGFYNLMFMSYSPIAVSHLPQYRDTLLSGKRSDYLVPTVPKQSFDKAYQKIEMKLRKDPEPSLLSLDFPEGIHWSEDVWFLYHVLKYNFRLKYTPIIKKCHISVSSFYNRLEKEFQSRNGLKGLNSSDCSHLFSIWESLRIMKRLFRLKVKYFILGVRFLHHLHSLVGLPYQLMEMGW
jgi:hypothetical protein